MKKVMVFLVLLLASLAGAFAQDKVDYLNILKEVDKLATFTNTDFTALVTIVTKDPAKDDKSVLKSQFFRRDKDDKFMVLISEPVVQKGQGYLKIDDNLWFYDPNTNEFQHTSLKENFSGSGARNNDFSKSTYADDYKVLAGETAVLAKQECWVLTLEAKDNTVPIPGMKIWVAKTGPALVLKTEEYSLSKRLERTNLFGKYSKIDGRFIATTMQFDDNLNPGKRTVMTLEKVNMGAIPDSIFTKAYLQKASGR